MSYTFSTFKVGHLYRNVSVASDMVWLYCCVAFDNDYVYLLRLWTFGNSVFREGSILKMHCPGNEFSKTMWKEIC